MYIDAQLININNTTDSQNHRYDFQHQINFKGTINLGTKIGTLRIPATVTHRNCKFSIANQKNRRAIEFFARYGKTRTAVLSVVALIPILSFFFSHSHSLFLSISTKWNVYKRKEYSRVSLPSLSRSQDSLLIVIVN